MRAVVPDGSTSAHGMRSHALHRWSVSHPSLVDMPDIRVCLLAGVGKSAQKHLLYEGPRTFGHQTQHGQRAGDGLPSDQHENLVYFPGREAYISSFCDGLHNNHYVREAASFVCAAPWPLKKRVGAISPKRWPTISSLTKTLINLWPL